jgi:CubicO group peptidase (beta-lactamase class C family)
MNDSSNSFSKVLPTTSPKDAGLSPAGLARLEAAMRREVEEGRLPGAAMLIARGGKVGYRGEVGLLRPGGPAMRGDAIFRIYSMTKPIVSVAIMMLFEEGRLLLSDPLAKYAPEFAALKVGAERDGKLELVPAERAITIQDLLRHTSGLTYAHTGDSAVQRLYAKTPLRRRDGSMARFIEMLAELPLIAEPGTSWDYSHSTDVLGHVVEIVSGRKLSDFLRERILMPLGMKDTDFFAPPEKQERLAEPFEKDPDTGEPVRLFDNRIAPGFEMGGSGLVSTIDDYARFAQMLLLGGALEGVSILGKKTVAFMTSDHLGPEMRLGSPHLLPPGHGFGLGFAVRRETGMAPSPGTIGEFYWSGLAGTAFWVAPREDLFAILMIQAQGQREYYRALFRNLVHAAMV